MSSSLLNFLPRSLGSTDSGFPVKSTAAAAGTQRTALGDISNRVQPNANGGLKKQSNVTQSLAQPSVRPSALSSHHLLAAPAPALDECDVQMDGEVMMEDSNACDTLSSAWLDEPKDAQQVPEYVDEIMDYLKSIEIGRQANSEYMNKQSDISARMREILIDWLVEVHLKFRLNPETLYLTVNLIDRFLERRLISRNKLQLVGCTAMLLASKYEEMYAPEVADFVAISDKAYTREQILQMEQIMLAALQFNLTVPSALRFGERFIALALDSAGAAVDSSMADQLKVHVSYLMELSLQEYRALQFTPSKIAAAATLIALSSALSSSSLPGLDGVPADILHSLWSPSLVRCSHYEVHELRDCCSLIVELARNENSKYRAVKKKYQLPKFFQVANQKIRAPF